ncbi:hypothetical protein HHI36_014092 [Cryptolaemus montrouzieri]|uniref:Major facilitator superfamily (MFS) profile domain-containing protein n=1 Tax=Cryptolaemus montrouzieri TaxID=559131 RepID=A0ABD2N1I5_9CUCU
MCRKNTMDSLKNGNALEKSEHYGFGVRHIQIVLIFSMVLILCCMNTCSSTAIVAMTNNNTSGNPTIPTFTGWTDQSFILFSYYWGYLLSLLLGGYLSRNFSFKWTMVVSVFCCSIIMECVPFVTKTFGYFGFMACLFSLGISQGHVSSMLPTFISVWVPVAERTTTGTFIFSSKTIGTILALQATGFLSRSWWGWPSVYQFFGLLGFIWIIFMASYGFIKYGQKRNKKKRVPWRSIFTSKATLATWVSHIGMMLTVRLVSIESPTYITSVLDYSIDTSSNTLTISQIIGYFNTFIISAVSEFLINRKILSIGTTRKICNSIAAYGSSIFLLVLALLPMENYERLIMIIPLFVCMNVSFSGYDINYNDLSPNFCSYIYGIGAFLSTSFSWVPPLLVYLMVKNQTNSREWSNVFIIAASVLSISNTIFIFNGSGEVQAYDDGTEVNIEDPDESTHLLGNSGEIKSKEYKRTYTK